jgi:hypothetical protein
VTTELDTLAQEAVRRSELAGWAQYGYCASRSRWFWGLRLHLVCTLHGLPVAFALTGAKADERDVLLAMLSLEAGLVTARPAQVLIGDRPSKASSTWSATAAGPSRA